MPIHVVWQNLLDDSVSYIAFRTVFIKAIGHDCTMLSISIARNSIISPPYGYSNAGDGFLTQFTGRLSFPHISSCRCNKNTGLYVL